METSFLSALTIGAAFAAGCAGQQRGGFDFTTDEPVILVPETVPVADMAQPPAATATPPAANSSTSTRKDLSTDAEIVSAGGLDSYIAKGARHDGRFRIYTFTATWCGACKLWDSEMRDVMSRRNDMDYTAVDVDGLTSTRGFGGVPHSIIKFSDCSQRQDYNGAPANASQLEQLLSQLKQQCGGA